MINQYQKPARYALSKIELKMEVNERIKEMFEHRNPDKHILKFEPGLNEDVVRNISKNKNEPEWMLNFRLKAFEVYKQKPVPQWGADLSRLDTEKITERLLKRFP